LVSGIDDVPEDMTEWIEDDGREIEVMKRIDGMCIAFTGNSCSIYDRRPLDCRDFKIGESRCGNRG